MVPREQSIGRFLKQKITRKYDDVGSEYASHNQAMFNERMTAFLNELSSMARKKEEVSDIKIEITIHGKEKENSDWELIEQYETVLLSAEQEDDN
jgi:hypothetical protein